MPIPSQQQTMPSPPQGPVNIPGIPNPATHQQNQYAPIPPDDVKRWAEVNHVSKGSIKQVEWSNNADKYIFTMKDGTSQSVAPDYIMQNKGHWAPSAVHEQSVIRHIMGKQAQQMQQAMHQKAIAQMGGGQQQPQVLGSQVPVMPGAQQPPQTPQPMMPG